MEISNPIAPQLIPAMAIPLPPVAPWLLEICRSPRMPKIIASSDGTNRHTGMPMIPRTSDATQNPLVAPLVSMVVPSMVNGMPQLLQLLAEIGLEAEQRGQTIHCFPSEPRMIFGARSPAAA